MFTFNHSMIQTDNFKMQDRDNRSLYVGNLDSRITEPLLFELFAQSGPVERVKIMRTNKKQIHGFITFKDEVSVNYAKELFEGTFLYEKKLNLKHRENSKNTDFTYTKMMKEYYANTGQQPQNYDSYNSNEQYGLRRGQRHSPYERPPQNYQNYASHSDNRMRDERSDRMRDERHRYTDPYASRGQFPYDPNYLNNYQYPYYQHDSRY